MKTYEVKVRTYSRREGMTNWWTRKLNASSAPSAITKVTRDYIKGLTRKEKRDAAKLMEVRCTYLGAALQEAPPEVYAMVDALIDGSAR